MDRKRMAQALREEASQLLKAAELLDGRSAAPTKPKRVVSEETRQKMREAHQKRIAAKKPARRPRKAKAE